MERAPFQRLMMEKLRCEHSCLLDSRPGYPEALELRVRLKDFPVLWINL